MLVVVPLGALPTALVFDALFVLRAEPAWYGAGFVATALGAGLLFAAMVPGLVDYFASVPRRGEVWKHAAVHAMLGLALVGYFIVSAAARWATVDDPTPVAGWSALVASLIGNVALASQAIIGRGLVLRHFLGVERDDVAELPPGSRSGRGP